MLGGWPGAYGNVPRGRFNSLLRGVVDNSGKCCQRPSRELVGLQRGDRVRV